jgi:hypothetical protein
MAFSSPFRLTTAVAAFAIIATGFAHAACTEKDQEAKMNQLSVLMTPLAQKDPPRAQKISEEMTSAMTLDGDAACVKLDELIAKAK